MTDPPLDESELAAALVEHPGWYVEAGKLRARRELPSFLAGIRFVIEVAQIAEELDHHPDIDIRWRTVTVAVNTHDSGGAITARDVELLWRIDAANGC
jgi:4a-hydroxytetrahydrobiopterin dehydratase